MRRHLSLKKSENGQIIPLVVLMMFAIIAIVALIIDGGFMMSNRRTAQAAADAGALAGAKQLCLGGTEADAKQAANSYVAKNKAVVVGTPEVDLETKQIKVTSEITNASFFAGIFGEKTLMVQAHAEAGCFPPDAGKYLLPIAWSCRPPVTGTSSESEDCQMKSLDYVTEFVPIISPTSGTVNIDGITYTTPFDFTQNILPQIYVIMDSVSQKSTSSDEYDLVNVCKPNGYMECDINGDGSPDILGAGDRGWLSFDGSNNENTLRDWLLYGYQQTLYFHTWLPANNAPRGNAFQAIETKIGKLVLLPVYNGICLGDPTGINNPCQTYVHSLIDLKVGETETIVLGNGTQSGYYHIISDAAFYITCVDSKGAGQAHCPGHLAAVDIGTLAKGDKTVEGYFVKGYPDSALSNPGEGGADTGIYVVSLIK